MSYEYASSEVVTNAHSSSRLDENLSLASSNLEERLAGERVSEPHFINYSNSGQTFDFTNTTGSAHADLTSGNDTVLIGNPTVSDISVNGFDSRKDTIFLGGAHLDDLIVMGHAGFVVAETPGNNPVHQVRSFMDYQMGNGSFVSAGDVWLTILF